jgi:D-3-phosphoglycerate dehydrogenase
LSVGGEIAQYDTRPLTAALIKGLLESVSDAHVNLVNAPTLARGGAWNWQRAVRPAPSNMPTWSRYLA